MTTHPATTPEAAPIDPQNPQAAQATVEGAAPADRPPTLDDQIDAELAATMRALSAQGLTMDGTMPAGNDPTPAAPQAAPVPTDAIAPAAPQGEQRAPIMIPKERFDQVLSREQAKDEELRALREQNAFLAGKASAGGGAPAATPTPAAPAKPQGPQSPGQAYKQADAARAALDTALEEDKLTAEEYRKKAREVDRWETYWVSQLQAQRTVAPLVHEVRAIPKAEPVDATGDLRFQEKTTALIDADPWIRSVPTAVLRAFDDDIMKMAQEMGYRIDNTPVGLYNYRLFQIGVAKGNNLHLAYGQSASPSTTPAGAPATGATPALPLGKPPGNPTASRPVQPVAIGSPATGAPAPTGFGLENLAIIPFGELMDANIPVQQLEAMVGIRRAGAI